MRMLRGVSRGVSRGVWYGVRGIHKGVYVPPSLVDLPKRWAVMRNTELQEEIKEYLDWQMEGPWGSMTKEEQAGAYHIAYGQWGPRIQNKTEQKDVNVSYFIFRVLFNITLISALGVSYVNWKHDKDHIAQLQGSSSSEGK